MDEIKVAYDKLDDVANRFNSQAEAIQSMLQLIQNSFSPLEGGGWMGQGAEAFISEMNSEIFPACQRLIEVLNEGNASTKAIADRFQQSEDEAANLFRNF